jgi:hypothetical protein
VNNCILVFRSLWPKFGKFQAKEVENIFMAAKNEKSKGYATNIANAEAEKANII